MQNQRSAGDRALYTKHRNKGDTRPAVVNTLLAGRNSSNDESIDMKNPWQLKSSRPIYNNPWISVREDAVINPSGGDGIYGVVEFKNLAIGIIPIDSDNHTWLVGQYRYSTEQYSWEIPMGGSPLADDPLQGAIRELAEETGLIASEWQHLMKLHTSNSVCDETGHVYIATGLQQGEAAPDETEQLTLRRVPLETAFDMALGGEITDCITLAGLLRLRCGLLSGDINLP